MPTNDPKIEKTLREPQDRELYLRYLGVLRLLADCAVYLPNSQEDIRESIERAMIDACANHPLQWRRVINRIEIWPDNRRGPSP